MTKLELIQNSASFFKQKFGIALVFMVLTLFFSAPSFSANEKDEITYSENIKTLDPARLKETAKIQVLDKTTAKAQDLSIKIGSQIDYGNIIIKIHKCWQAPLDQRPDSKILMEVFEKTKITKTQNEDGRIFFGWMIASSPSVSGLEHPVYDIIALGCY